MEMQAAKKHTVGMEKRTEETENKAAVAAREVEETRQKKHDAIRTSE